MEHSRVNPNLVQLDLTKLNYDQTALLKIRITPTCDEIFFVLDVDLPVAVMLGTDAQTIFELKIWVKQRQCNKLKKHPIIIRKFTHEGIEWKEVLTEQGV